jgi:hypothetical protein
MLWQLVSFMVCFLLWLHLFWREILCSMGVARGLSRRTELPSISFYFGYISFIVLHTLMYAHARACTQPYIPDEQWNYNYDSWNFWSKGRWFELNIFNIKKQILIPPDPVCHLSKTSHCSLPFDATFHMFSFSGLLTLNSVLYFNYFVENSDPWCSTPTLH